MPDQYDVGARLERHSIRFKLQRAARRLRIVRLVGTENG